MLQLEELFNEINSLHKRHGDSRFFPIYGAGRTKNPRICMVFMNPTARNISAHSSWKGIRAPWIGTKQVWKLLFELDLIRRKEIIYRAQVYKPNQWTERFAEELYSEVSNESLYITNIAKCTQPDARTIKSKVFKDFVNNTKKELLILDPEIIITFGNVVSSTLLEKPISVSNYINNEYETINIDTKTYKIYPSYYPVGQGTPNLPKAIERIKRILD